MSLNDSDYIEHGMNASDLVLGKIVKLDGDAAWIDVGWKTEQLVPIEDLGLLDDVSPEIGQTFEFFVESVEGEGLKLFATCSRGRIDRRDDWSQFVNENTVGDVVKAVVLRRIKSGFLVNLGNPPCSDGSKGVNALAVADSLEIGSLTDLRIVNIEPSRKNIVLRPVD